MALKRKELPNEFKSFKGIRYSTFFERLLFTPSSNCFCYDCFQLHVQPFFYYFICSLVCSLFSCLPNTFWLSYQVQALYQQPLTSYNGVVLMAIAVVPFCFGFTRFVFWCKSHMHSNTAISCFISGNQHVFKVTMNIQPVCLSVELESEHPHHTHVSLNIRYEQISNCDNDGNTTRNDDDAVSQANTYKPMHLRKKSSELTCSEVKWERKKI